MLVSETVFFEKQTRMPYISFEQSKGWHDYQLTLKKEKVLYFIDQEDEPSICAWGMIRKLSFFGSILQIKGEAKEKDVTRRQIQKFYDDIAEYSRGKYFFVWVSSSDLYSVDYEIGIRQAGYVRPLVQSVCPLSIIVDLEASEERSKSWKKRLKEAEKHNLIFSVIDKPEQNILNVVCEMYAELSKTKSLGYHLSADSLADLFRDPHLKLFLVYSSDNKPLCARIVYVRDDFAYDIIAANFNVSRTIRGTTYFMVESILSYLKERGVKRFDFGRIGPGKRSSNSVYEFKAYVGAPEVQYNGEWVFANNRFIETLFFNLLNLRLQRF